MTIVGFVGFAGVALFGLLYIVFFLKGASLKIPVIGMTVFGLALAAAVVLAQMGITLPWDSTADEPSESASASGEVSGFTPAPELTSEPAPPSAPATVEEFEQILIGSWSNADRTDNRIVTYCFNFFADGYFDAGGNIYDNIHTYYNPEMENYPEDEYGWYEQHQNAGLLGDSGNYSLTALENGRFALRTVLFSDVNRDWYTRELTYVDDNTIRIDGETYVRGSDYTLAEFAEIFDFDIEVEDTVDHPIETEDTVDNMDNPVEEFERILVGSWSNANRVGDELSTNYFDFPVKGEVEIGGFVYINRYNSEDLYWGEEDEYGWFVAPMGHPSFYGSYSLTALGNGRFALTAVGEWTDAGPLTSTYELTYVNNNTILIDGATYVRGGNYTLAELARIFGFAIEP